MTLEGCLSSATEKLKSISSTPRLDAEVLLTYATNIKKTSLYTHPERLLTTQENAQFDRLISKRLSGIPLAYIMGEKEFWSLSFKVTPDVLIPRPETEHLVEIALSTLPKQGCLDILELGTGSGAIAIAIAYERPQWKILASDYSAAALAIARENAARLLSTEATVSFCLSHWFEDLPTQQFSAILSNPPYIEENDSHLKDLTYEPIQALTSGSDGLNDIRHIIKNAPLYLKHEGMLALEHGYNQGKKIRDLLRLEGFHCIETFQDLAKNERITIGKIAK